MVEKSLEFGTRTLIWAVLQEGSVCWTLDIEGRSPVPTEQRVHRAKGGVPLPRAHSLTLGPDRKHETPPPSAPILLPEGVRSPSQVHPPVCSAGDLRAA